MISIIICSRRTNIDNAIARNIKDTIGNVEYEVIWIDNSQNQRNIFEAYNYGVSQANYQYLCFMHEDIKFHSKDWGKEVCKLFEEVEVGMLGIVGTAHVSKHAYFWWNDYACHGSLIQGKTVNGKYHTFRQTHDDTTSNQVVAIDGMWMCIRKKLFDNHEVCWDDKTFNGFHLYDLDMSMQVYESGYITKTADRIEVEHMSYGVTNNLYYDNLLLFHKKWNNHLPAKANDYVLPSDFDDDITAMQGFIDCSKMHNYYKNEYERTICSHAFKLGTYFILPLRWIKTLFN